MLLLQGLPVSTVSSNKTSPPNSPTEALLSGNGHSGRMINVSPLTPHCESETTGRNYFSWWAGARLWQKNRANTVYHRPDDSPPWGKLTTRLYRLAGSRCPFTLINLPVFLFQLYQSNLREDTQHWSVNTAYYCTQTKQAHGERGAEVTGFYKNYCAFYCEKHLSRPQAQTLAAMK